MKKNILKGTIYACLLAALMLSCFFPAATEETESGLQNVVAGLIGVSNDEGFTWEPDQVGMKYLTDGRKLIYEGTKISSWQSSYLSQQDVNVTIDFALEEEYNISKVALYPRGSDGKFFPEDYKILVSADGENWTEVFAVTGDTKLAKEGRFHEFDEVKASYVRLCVTKAYAVKASKGYVISLSEFEVYGKPKETFNLTKEEIWMTPGETDKITPVTIGGTEADFTFSSSDESVVSCTQDGKVTAIGQGDAIITVKDTKSGILQDCKVKVINKEPENIIIAAPMWTDTYITEKQIRLLYEAGVNVISKHHNLSTKDAIDDTGIEDVEKMVEALRYTWEDGTPGMKVFILTGELENALVNAGDEQVMNFIEKYKNYPMLGGFHVKDEPFYPNPYARIVRMLNENISSNAMINFLPGGVYSNYEQYADVMRDYVVLLGESRKDSFLSMDNYPFLWNSRAVDEHSLFSNFDAIRRVGLQTGMNTGFYVQGTGLKNGYRRPSESDLTYHFSAGLAYGMKLIQYYTWFVPDSRPDDHETYTDAIIDKNGDPTELYDLAKTIHTQIHNIGTKLVQMDAVEVYHSGNKSTSSAYRLIPSDFAVQPVENEYAIVSLMVDRNTGRNHIMLVNKDLESSQTLDFTFKGIDRLYMLDKTVAGGPEKEVILEGNKLSVTLKAGDFVLYALPENVDITAGEEIDETNILSGKIPWDASDSYSQDGWYFSKLTDGITVSTDSSKGWKTTHSSATLTYSLGENMDFNRLDVYPAGNGSASGASFPCAIKIRISDDGVNYTQIADHTNVRSPKYDVPVFTFDTVSAKYVQFVFEGSELSGMEICELALYLDDGSIPKAKTDYEPLSYEKGENVALGKSVYSSEIGWSSEAEGLGYAYLTDGYSMVSKHPVNGGYWTSAWPADYHKAVDEPAWVAVDLGSTYYIDQVNLYPRGTDGRFFPQDYDIQVSKDGINWTTVKTVTGDNSIEIKGRVINFDEVEARYVRVLILKHFATSASKGYTSQISEMEVITSRTVVEQDNPSTGNSRSILLPLLVFIISLTFAIVAGAVYYKKRKAIAD